MIKGIDSNTGWVCPKCGKVYGPSTTECSDCNSWKHGWKPSPIERTNQDKDYVVGRCTCHDPLLMVIPPEGVTIRCPVHGHAHISGPPWATC